MTKEEISLVRDYYNEFIKDEVICSGGSSAIPLIQIFLREDVLYIMLKLGYSRDIRIPLEDVSAENIFSLFTLFFQLPKLVRLELDNVSVDLLERPNFLNLKYLELEELLCYNLNTVLKKMGKEVFI